MLQVNILLSLLGWTFVYPCRSRRLGVALVALRLLASASTLPNSPLLYSANGCRVVAQHAQHGPLCKCPRSLLLLQPPTTPETRERAQGEAARWVRAESLRRVGAK